MAVAVAAPAMAASSSAISGSQQVVRTATDVTATGSVTNGSSTNQTVTLDWLVMCDSSGPGAGTCTSGITNAAAVGWTVSIFTYASAAGSSQRGVRLVVSRDVAAGSTVAFPFLTVGTSASTVTGTVTATLSAPAPAVVVQPASLNFTAFAGAAASTTSGGTLSRGTGVTVLR